MSDKVEEWTSFFKKVFSETKKQIQEQYRLEKDGSGPPQTIGIREITENLRFPVRIADIKFCAKEHEHVEDETCQIIRYDFSQLGKASSTVEYLGVFDASDDKRLKKLLVESFGVGDDFLDGFQTTGMYDKQTNVYIQFSPYDTRKNFNRFFQEFVWFVLDMAVLEKVRQESSKGVDWLSRFKLSPDPILTYDEVTKMDRIVGFFSPFARGAGIEKLQEDICNIQLIPDVPEEVKKIFRNAKDLYIYGFFRYNFFTIAQHYAFLALESAIKRKYYQSFQKENFLTNEKNESAKIGEIDHQKIIDFCKRSGWHIRKLWINGEKFAYRISDLLDWLEKNRIITNYERKLCSRGMNMRNYMSHLTNPWVITLGHSARSLEFVADVINRLYSPLGARSSLFKV